MNSKTFDFVIIGGGPAGLFAGILLSHKGYRVLIAERNKQSVRKICGEYLCPYGVKIMEDEGFGDFLRLRFPKINGLRITSPDGSSVRSLFSQIGDVYGYAVRRGDFETELLNANANQNLIFESGMKLTGLRKSDAGFHCTLNNRENIFGKILIGADGIFSPTAKMLGLKKKIRSNRIALHSILPNHMSEHDIARMYILKNGSYIGLNPSGDELNVTAVCDKAVLNKNYSPADAFREMINLSGLDFLQQEPLEGIRKLSPVSAGVNAEITHRAVLLGDAAGFLDPLTGEGMSVALFSASLLAKKLTQNGLVALNNNDTVQNILTSYLKKKKSYFRTKNMLNMLFLKLIHKPTLCNRTAEFLNARQQRAEIFMGMLSNNIHPLEGMYQMFTPYQHTL